MEASDVVVQGDDPWQWIRAQRFNWDQLVVGQRGLLEILELESAAVEKWLVQRAQNGHVGGGHGGGVAFPRPGRASAGAWLCSLPSAAFVHRFGRRGRVRTSADVHEKR
ncbi:hypothetical protein, partial [Streptomyces sp. NPDC050504]|uniref:hypothetical protein n=1 Tax=Streptomyces sp. NPDC050504 TaxID=3365618 RepID=UPI0037B7EBFA